MQWSAEKNAGFTEGTPWLKVNPNYTSINAANQQDDPDSVRNFYKKLIALRKDPAYKETIVYGTLEPVWENRHNLMAYYRKGEKTLMVVGNYQNEVQEITLPSDCQDILLNNYADIIQNGNTIQMYGYQVLILELTK